jgi:hypothetical protein
MRHIIEQLGKPCLFLSSRESGGNDCLRKGHLKMILNMKAILKRTLGKGSIPSLWNVMLNYAMGCSYDRHTTSSTDITYKANHRTNFDSQLKTPSPIPNCTSFKMGSDVMLTRCASQQTRLSPWRTPTIHYGGINGSEKIYGK